MLLATATCCLWSLSPFFTDKLLLRSQMSAPSAVTNAPSLPLSQCAVLPSLPLVRCAMSPPRHHHYFLHERHVCSKVSKHSASFLFSETPQPTTMQRNQSGSLNFTRGQVPRWWCPKQRLPPAALSSLPHVRLQLQSAGESSHPARRGKRPGRHVYHHGVWVRATA
jgi:hypothetical protein